MILNIALSISSRSDKVLKDDLSQGVDKEHDHSNDS